MPLFEDYDKVHIGSVTRSQFHRVLSELELGGESILKINSPAANVTNHIQDTQHLACWPHPLVLQVHLSDQTHLPIEEILALWTKWHQFPFGIYLGPSVHLVLFIVMNPTYEYY